MSNAAQTSSGLGEVDHCTWVVMGCLLALYLSSPHCCRVRKGCVCKIWSAVEELMRSNGLVPPSVGCRW